MTAMTLPGAMPTSGSARRRAKATRNLANSHWLESLEAYRTGGIPRSAIAVSICPCGRTAWLMPGGAAEEHEAFDHENADHDDYCTEAGAA